MSVKAIKGPNGTIEVKQMNGVQGWHSGYLSPEKAREFADDLRRLADEVESGK